MDDGERAGWDATSARTPGRRAAGAPRRRHPARVVRRHGRQAARRACDRLDGAGLTTADSTSGRPARRVPAGARAGARRPRAAVRAESLELVAAYVGMLRAGATVVPVDAAPHGRRARTPRERRGPGRGGGRARRSRAARGRGGGHAGADRGRDRRRGGGHPLAPRPAGGRPGRARARAPPGDARLHVGHNGPPKGALLCTATCSLDARRDAGVAVERGRRARPRAPALAPARAQRRPRTCSPARARSSWAFDPARLAMRCATRPRPSCSRCRQCTSDLTHGRASATRA